MAGRLHLLDGRLRQRGCRRRNRSKSCTLARASAICQSSCNRRAAVISAASNGLRMQLSSTLTLGPVRPGPVLHHLDGDPAITGRAMTSGTAARARLIDKLLCWWRTPQRQVRPRPVAGGAGMDRRLVGICEGFGSVKACVISCRAYSSPVSPLV